MSDRSKLHNTSSVKSWRGQASEPQPYDRGRAEKRVLQSLL